MSTTTGSAPRITMVLAQKTPMPLGSLASVGMRNVSGAIEVGFGGEQLRQHRMVPFSGTLFNWIG